MKPSWEDAPEWANYLVMDSDGGWWWFQCEPSTNGCGGWSSNCGNVLFSKMESFWFESMEVKP